MSYWKDMSEYIRKREELMKSALTFSFFLTSIIVFSLVALTYGVKKCEDKRKMEVILEYEHWEEKK